MSVEECGNEPPAEPLLPTEIDSVVTGSERPWPLPWNYWAELGQFMSSRPKKKRVRRGLLDRRVP